MNPAYLPWREEHIVALDLKDGGATWIADGFRRLGDYLAKHLAFARWLEGRGK